MNQYCVHKSQEEGYILTEIPQWRVLAGCKFWTCDLSTQIFHYLQPYPPCRIWPFSWLHNVRPHSSGQYSRGPLCSSRQQAVQTFPEPKCLERVCHPSAWLSCSHKRGPALVLVSITWSSQTVSHPSIIQACSCLTSVFEWELVFPTWHGPLLTNELC